MNDPYCTPEQAGNRERIRREWDHEAKLNRAIAAVVEAAKLWRDLGKANDVRLFEALVALERLESKP